MRAARIAIVVSLLLVLLRSPWLKLAALALAVVLLELWGRRRRKRGS